MPGAATDGHLSKVQDMLHTQQPTRPVYVYEIPASLGLESPKSVSLRELTANEELDAAKRARGDAFKTANELVKSALIEVDEKPVNLGDGSADIAWNQMPAKVRNLVLDAYQEIHVPPQGASQDFRKSRKVRVS
jgi:hypothetical protein